MENFLSSVAQFSSAQVYHSKRSLLAGLALLLSLFGCSDNNNTSPSHPSYDACTDLVDAQITDKINDIIAIHSDLLAPTSNFSFVSPGTADTDVSYQNGESVELMLYYPERFVSNIHWQQVSGPDVNFLSGNSKVIAFTAQQAGNYRFSVQFRLNGLCHKKELSFSVEDNSEDTQLTARLGHAVAEGNKVSLRAFLHTGSALTSDELSNTNITWRQLTSDGQGVNLTYSSNNLVSHFTAPDVTQDTILTFEVSANLAGKEYKDLVAVLVEHQSVNVVDDYQQSPFTERLAKVFPYHADSPYADNLQQCVYSNHLNYQNACTFEQLPLLAMESTNPQTYQPSIDDIMDRVLVSHAWMGDRFIDFLTDHDNYNDFKTLLKATTAIVISSDIRPAFYHPYTGAIYLDPDDLWLTADERDTINEAPDFRSEFGKELNFLMPWLYVKNNRSLSRYYSPLYRSSRSLTNIVYPFSALLYHELAHANDYYPVSTWSEIEREFTVPAYTNFYYFNELLESDILSQQLPLQGEEMYALAQVDFHGEQATAEQKAYTPEDVATFFKDEAAPQFYNYSSKREDYAMLFDGFMMYARYGVFRDVAVTNMPQGDDISAADYIVTWGQRGRMAETQIKPRVKHVVDSIMPGYSYAQNLIDNLPAPIDMTPGLSLAENISLTPISSSAQQRVSPKPLAEELEGEALPFDQRRHKNIQAIHDARLAKKQLH